MRLNLLNFKKNSPLTSNTSAFNYKFNLLILISIFTQTSSQPTSFQNIPATCIYSYNPQNIYTCDLHNATNPYPDGTLEIIGNHLPGRTDDDVMALFHVNSQMRQFNGEVLRKFINLETLSLSDSILSSVSPNAFEVCGRLKVLNIRLNFLLRNLPQKMLQNCRNLRHLNLDFNRIQTISNDLFGSSTALENFNMRSNTMTSFADNVLQNMTNLRIFDVSSNQLTTLNRINFVNAMNLEEFNIGWNRIIDGQEVMNTLNGHLSLKVIRLNNNQFKIFSFNFFSQFQRLEVLAVGGGQNLTDILWQVLPVNLMYLRVLEIGEEIPENAFYNLGNLTELYLTGLGISNLQQDTFKYQTNLKVLHITEASISALNPHLFRSLINLHTLSMQRNQIKELPEGVFEPLKSLGLGSFQRVLTMSHNRITRLPLNLFGQHPHLFHIDFSFNQINGIQRGIFSRFNPFMAQAEFLANECTSASLWNVTDVDQNEDLEWCFNSFEGFTTTTPKNTGSVLKKFNIVVGIFFCLFLLKI